MAQRICSIEECSDPAKGRGYCNKHLIRLRRHGDPSAIFPNKRERCSIEGCDGRHHARGWCIKHWSRWHSTGDPLAVRARVNPVMVGDLNPKWRGDDVGYAGAHLRMWRADPARNHDCLHCGLTAESWAYDHGDPDEKESDRGPYSVDWGHYVPLCYSCHTKFDKGREALRV